MTSPPSPSSRALLLAASSGDVDAVQRALEDGADPLACDELDNSALHVGAFYPDVVLVLLKAGAYVNARDHHQETPLHRAAEEGRWDSARMLMEWGADPLAKGENDLPPLLVLLRGGGYEHACALTGLAVASRAGGLMAHARWEALESWLNAFPDAHGLSGETLFIAAMEQPQRAGSGPFLSQAMERLMAHGFLPTALFGGQSLLAHALAYGGHDTLTTLLTGGADPNAKGGDGRSAMHVLAEVNHSNPEVVQKRFDLLVAHGGVWTEESLAALRHTHANVAPLSLGGFGAPSRSLTGPALVAWAAQDALRQALERSTPEAGEAARRGRRL